MKTTTIRQSELSAECWNIQVWGIEACENCEVKGTDECGGKNIIKTGENEKGFKVPLEKGREDIR